MGIDGTIFVHELVTRPAVYVHPNDTLRRLSVTLAEESIGAALVRGPHGAIGLVSERDVVLALADGADPDRVTAADVMNEDLVTAGPNEELLVAVHRMLDAEIRHLPVTEDGVAGAMISARDALRILVEQSESAA